MSIFELSEKLRGASEMARLRRLSEDAFASLTRSRKVAPPPTPAPVMASSMPSDSFIFTAR